MNYKYGVTYTTNCKKPDLPDGIVVEQFYNGGWHSLIKPVERFGSWSKVTAFRIVDERYMSEGKSNALTSETSLTHRDSSLTHNWFERGELPPVGAECEVVGSEDDDYHKCKVIAHEAMDEYRVAVFSIDNYCGKQRYYSCCVAKHFRQIRTEREKAIDAAIDCIPEIDGVRAIAGRLFDAGLLRLPEGK